MNAWILKALAQKILSGVPGGNAVNYRAQNILGRHRKKNITVRIPSLVDFIQDVDAHKSITASDILEFGTGWGAINALILSAMGANSVTATDYTPHVRLQTVLDTLEAIRQHADLIASVRKTSREEIQSELDRLISCNDIDELFSIARIKYLAPFNACATDLGDKSVDLIYSYAVLAHINKKDLKQLAIESNRVLKPGGVIAHKVGLQDPYNGLNGGSNVNFLKFSDRIWELFFQNSIQYNNRVRASEHINIYRELGAEILCSDTVFYQRDIDVLRSFNLDSRYAGMELEDLAATSVKLICRVR